MTHTLLGKRLAELYGRKVATHEADATLPEDLRPMICSSSRLPFFILSYISLARFDMQAP